jgi:competence CoiA-like predicted nuclease
MSRKQRSIKIAFDKLTGEILDADVVFNKKTNDFEIRKQFQKKKLLLSCCECEQDLNISDSKYDRLYFKHQPYHNFCILTDGDLSPKDHRGFTEILKTKESDRHKELKNKIGQLLAKVEGVDSNSIAIDNKFIIRGNEKRRPDVYCKYNEKELVFEIQLSDLSLGYILSRYEFYKKNGMYLIWILDNFDIHNQGTLERDIKYLTKYENFFKLDEKSETFKLRCDYKCPLLTDGNELRTPWAEKSVSLSQIKFDNFDCQIYYHNFGEKKTEQEALQKRNAELIKEEERKKVAERKLSDAKWKANNIISEIKELKELSKKESQVFNSVTFEISELDQYELDILNSTLDLTNRAKHKTPPLLKWIDKATKHEVAFILFLLSCREIEININEKNAEGKTAFQAVCENSEIYKTSILRALLKRGYILTEDDKSFFTKLPDSEIEKNKDLILYSICNSLSDRELVDSVFTHEKLLFIIESAKRKVIIGFKWKQDEWIGFANSAIYNHKEYWEYIELAFKSYGLWETLLKLDKKGTFHKKINELYKEIPKQKFDFDEVFRDLYPDIAN